ncbi:UNVERIFIED_CONTAM: Amino acid transporter AVT1I [Sesamum radiatum]|uniref:Amino acid transporter AVT1I n=1 Tax=Sesamum radiatum TaxID=300843 RepID=A0AAW2N0C9_SESRA
MYGDNVMSQVTLNLLTRNTSSKIAIYTTLINPVTKYAIIFTPIATALEEILILRDSRMIRTSLVISTVMVALVVPFFGYVMAFIGVFLSISASILFPCLCYLKINKESRRFGVELMFILAILVLGFIVAVMGTFISVREIVRHVRNE